MTAVVAESVIPEYPDIPPRKRKRATQTPRGPKRDPRLFVPFRALGIITNHVPFVLQTRSYKGTTDGPRLHILTCLGRSWALWEGGKMTLLFVGPDVPSPITCLALDGDAVWAASGPHLIKYLRGKEVSCLSNPSNHALSTTAIFGTQILALTEDGRSMMIWDTGEEVLQSTIQFPHGFTATHLLHPSTYLNKILVASSQGDMQLWNIRTRLCVHKFSSSNLLTTQGPSTAGITALTQSPAIDVVGIGFSSGEIAIYDIRADERLIRLFMEGGSVRALGFRSDGQSILASASSTGHIALWDLNAGGRLLHMVRGAHDGAICAVDWVPGQPVLITSGEDNSVKQWLFDSPTSAPRLLKFRCGHHSPPHLIRHYGQDGKQLLSAARDRSLRCMSVVRDSRSFELSQGSLSKKASTLSVPLTALKLPPITALAYSTTRSKDWDDVITAHVDETFVRSWSVIGKRLGKHNLGLSEERKSKNPSGAAKAVCVSACGNFAIGSSSTGAIHMWNLQSGIRRKTFHVGPCPPDVVNRLGSSTKKKGSDRSVTGLASDSLNRLVLASTLDGTLNFFDFASTQLLHTLVLPSSVVSIMLHRNSRLLAIVCDDMVVRLIDIETRRIVRELGGFNGRVLDVAFSPDGRWLVVASLDSAIRTFDIPSGRLIDAFRTSSMATSISFSPSNDFLATAHVDSVGIYLWANRAQFSDISFQGITDEEVVDMSLPSVQGQAEDEALEALSNLTVQDQQLDVFSTPPKLEGDLVTLTLLPRSRWQTLLNLEVIQHRNKPKEPPKEPEKAPFFLQTLPGVEHRYSIEQKKETEETSKLTRRLDKIAAESESTFLKKLVAENRDGEYEDFFAYVKYLSPAATDLEIRSLASLDGLSTFLHALTHRLLSRRDFEAVQTLQSIFMRIHGDALVENVQLHGQLSRLQAVHQEESDRILELMSAALGTLAFVKDIV